jgi:hypothetical protein
MQNNRKKRQFDDFYKISLERDTVMPAQEPSNRY